MTTYKRPSGLYVLNQVTEVVEQQAREIMSMVVCGLHHYYLHEPLPKDTSFWIGRLQTKEQIDAISNDITSFSGEYHKGAHEAVDDGAVFSCSYVDLSIDPHDYTTLWLLTFYENVVYTVATNLIMRNDVSHSTNAEIEPRGEG